MRRNARPEISHGFKGRRNEYCLFAVIRAKVLPMTRRIRAAVIASALLADTTTAGAQMRLGRDGGQAAPVAGRIRESPSTRSTADRAENPPTDARSTATLKFVPGVPDVRQFPFPLHMGLGWASFGYVPLWSLNGVTPLQAVPAVLVPPHEGAPIGGVQLDIEPRRAQVYVDGAYVGVVSDFSGYYQHLDLVAGPHLVTIVAPNCEPLIIHVMVSPGHTLTYRGTLTGVYGR